MKFQCGTERVWNITTSAAPVRVIFNTISYNKLIRVVYKIFNSNGPRSSIKFVKIITYCSSRVIFVFPFVQVRTHVFKTTEIEILIQNPVLFRNKFIWLRQNCWAREKRSVFKRKRKKNVADFGKLYFDKCIIKSYFFITIIIIITRD